jgi:hypothetical protein
MKTNGATVEISGKTWVVVDRLSIQIGKKDGKAAYLGGYDVAMVKARGKQALCIFSTKELAAEYICRHWDHNSMIALSPGLSEKLVEFLERMARAGCTHVMIDCLETGRMKPMEIALENARSGRPL